MMGSYCKAHPDYIAKRRPKAQCYSCWRLFLAEKKTTALAYASAISKQDYELDAWLREHEDDIAFSPLVPEEDVPAPIKTVETPKPLVPHSGEHGTLI
jgi:hypothetical protein